MRRVARTKRGKAFHKSMAERRPAILSNSFRAPGRPDPRMELTLKDMALKAPVSKEMG